MIYLIISLIISVIMVYLVLKWVAKDYDKRHSMNDAEDDLKHPPGTIIEV